MQGKTEKVLFVENVVVAIFHAEDGKVKKENFKIFTHGTEEKGHV